MFHLREAIKISALTLTNFLINDALGIDLTFYSEWQLDSILILWLEKCFNIGVDNNKAIYYVFCVSDAELEDFIDAIVKAANGGILATNNVTFSSSWSFGQSFFFVGTFLTTIGELLSKLSFLQMMKIIG